MYFQLVDLLNFPICISNKSSAMLKRTFDTLMRSTQCLFETNHKGYRLRGVDFSEHAAHQLIRFALFGAVIARDLTVL